MRQLVYKRIFIFPIWISYILRRPQNFAKSSLYFCPMLCQSKVRWRFRKILWRSQNTWTLNIKIFYNFYKHFCKTVKKWIIAKICPLNHFLDCKNSVNYYQNIFTDRFEIFYFSLLLRSHIKNQGRLVHIRFLHKKRRTRLFSFRRQGSMARVRSTWK